MARRSIAAGMIALVAVGASAGAADRRQPQAVTVDPVVLRDGSAGGTIVRVSFPATGHDLPLVILSHGNRLSRTDYQPLVTALVRDGYVVVQPDHGDAAIDGFVPAAPQPDDVWRTRIAQIRWIADHPQAVARLVPALRGRIDATQIAIVGHSFGGHTAALAMGATIVAPDNGRRMTYPAPAIRVAVLLAPPGHDAGLTPEWKRRAPYLKLDWTTMRGPVLTINGMADMTPLTDQGPGWHDDPYRLGPTRGTFCLVRLPQVGHYLGGIDTPLRLPTGDATPERQARVIGTMIAFLDAGLGRTTAAARDWQRRRADATCREGAATSITPP
jgi:dienelactone hydrolase